MTADREEFEMSLDMNTVMLGTEDPKGLVEFYTKVFGEPFWADGSYTGWKVGAAWFMIGGHDQVKGRNESPGRILVNFETPDVQGEFDRIKGAGAKVVADPYSPGGGMQMATLEDPDGNYFQLASPVTDEMLKQMQEMQQQ